MTETNNNFFASIATANYKRVDLYGQKSCMLADLYQNLVLKKTKDLDIKIPEAFFISGEVYKQFLKQNKLEDKILGILDFVDLKDLEKLQHQSKKVKELIKTGKFDSETEKQILEQFDMLAKSHGIESQLLDVAVRSSATLEDLPKNSSAGQQDSFLNISRENLVEAIKEVYGSLFTDRAIAYRLEKKLDHLELSMPVLVQKMARSDLGSSGVMFTIDPDSGFKNLIVIQGSWGLGEFIAKGEVTPDEFFVYISKTSGQLVSVGKKIGSKEKKLIYFGPNLKQTKAVPVEAEDRHKFILNSAEVLTLASIGKVIQDYYGKAMDIEWAYEEQKKQFYILQARQETVHFGQDEKQLKVYNLLEKSQVLATGAAVGNGVTQGLARIVEKSADFRDFKKGEILVSRTTDPSWSAVLSLASGIVSKIGGRTSHAAILSRELGIPAVIGCGQEMEKIQTGDEITLSCAEGETGKIYKGLLPFKVENYDLSSVNMPKTQVCIKYADPKLSFQYSFLPAAGVGIFKQEELFTSITPIDPLLFLNYEDLSVDSRDLVLEQSYGYENPKQALEEKVFTALAEICCGFSGKTCFLQLAENKSNPGFSGSYGNQINDFFKTIVLRLLKNAEFKNICLVLPYNFKDFTFLENLPEGISLAMTVSAQQDIEALTSQAPEIFEKITTFFVEVGLEQGLYDYRDLEYLILFLTRVKNLNKKVGIVWPEAAEFSTELEKLIQFGFHYLFVSPKQALKTCVRVLEFEKRK